jgi:NAD(P)-dependent dehydrogenase (short-subunit alcohol dehydrogenase family)
VSALAANWPIDGRVALVTGAGGGGTGRAIAVRLARGGASVVVDDLDEQGGTATLRLIEEAGGHAVFVRADVTSETDIERIVAVAERTFGGLDILVNNAGGTPRPHFPEAEREHWGRTLDLNLRGPMLAIQEALPAMRKRGGGAIVNISSVAGVGYAPHSSPEYSAAKAGLARLTATLAPLQERENVRVNCIVPNWIGTEEVLAEIAAMSPEERLEVPDVLTTPEEIADLVVQLVEDPSVAGRVFVWWTGRPPEPMPIDAGN